MRRGGRQYGEISSGTGMREQLISKINHRIMYLSLCFILRDLIQAVVVIHSLSRPLL